MRPEGLRFSPGLRSAVVLEAISPLWRVSFQNRRAPVVSAGKFAREVAKIADVIPNAFPANDRAQR